MDQNENASGLNHHVCIADGQDLWAGDLVEAAMPEVIPQEWLRNQQGPNGTTLVPMCAPRFSSMHKMLRSLQQNKQALTNTGGVAWVDADERSKLIKEHHASAEAQEEWESFMAAQVVLDAPQHARTPHSGIARQGL
ncbi:hypothetical protein HaLaN_09049 [Haematococcus lacustris]|uniref:Uncharacterized protein n=1 Tax=Haematococcus lacustris TaxID=44745 RepID=A0A699ZCK4_HAELA|nr:hypothetical protein HaLaN_09049 [Haematococcus lacustris]